MHSSYSCRFFPRPPPLQICGGVLHFLRDEVSAAQAKRQPLGLFFFYSFLVLRYIFLLIFNASFVHFLQFSFGFSLWFLLCIRCAAPYFCVYIMKKNGSSLAGRGDCGGDDNCIVETKTAGLH